MRWALILALGLPSAVQAQDSIFDITPTAECEVQGGALSCVGLAANACMDTSEGGYSTHGMSACTDLEMEWWDTRLNTVYRQIRDKLAAQDAESPDYAPPQVGALKEMQRAWISFRDAKCEFVATEYMGGSGAGPATIWCLMDETARQALYLEGRAQN